MADLIIDPGHGGTDPGANGFGVKEKDWTLKMSLYQYNRLKELGASVAITRTTDKTLDSVPRTNLIKNKHKYCMSNHFNAFNGTARGVETIHSYLNNGKVANQLADAVVKASGLPLRRVFTRRLDSGADYYFMHRLTGNTTTIIVEYGFIDNEADHDFYKNEDNFEKVAESVVKEWCSILGVKYVAPKAASKPKTSTSSNPKIRTGGLNEKNLAKVVAYLKDKGWYASATISKGNNPKITTGGLNEKNYKEFSAWLDKQGFYYSKVK